MSINSEINKITFDLVSKLGDIAQNDVKTMLRLNGKYASGKLINSIIVGTSQTDKGIKLILKYEEYGKYVLSGRKPNSKMPPVSKIQEWCRYKGIPEGAAYAIARKIGKVGIKPFNFISPFMTLNKKIIAIIKYNKASFTEKLKTLIVQETKKK